MPTTRINFIDELQWRGLFYQASDEPGVRDHLASGTRRAYAGFDPTADSLTIGNLVPIMMLRRFQEAGHRPVVVMGGGTGLIGDPSGKEKERDLRTVEEVQGNVDAQRPIFESILDFDGPNAAMIVNNYEWLGDLKFIEVLRDVGKHFSVNQMIQKESVRERLTNREQGISFTEFCYVILQAYDFMWLRRHHDVTIQLGGSDQWGNMVSGMDLIRRLEPEGRNESWVVTNPLVTKADGGKFGKTETGAVWLTADRTSPYAFFQFWLNAADADVIRFLKFFTLLPQERIAELESIHESEPHRREAHRELARAATTLVHGADAAETAEAAGKALFSGEVSRLDRATLEEVFAEVPSSNHAKAELGSGLSLVDFLVETSLAKSKRESREFLGNGAVTVNERKVGPDDTLSSEDLLHGDLMLIRRGKKSWHVCRWG